MNNDLDLLPPLMKRRGVVDKVDFHRIVNISFHNYEAGSYDAIHSDMNIDLQEQLDILAADAVAVMIPEERSLRFLEIGCGTGLSMEKFLNTEMFQYIQKVDLLDTSPAMLKLCAEKAKNWNVAHELIEGDINSLPSVAIYDGILICSVLNHIPNLGSFFNTIESLLKRGGVIIHLQDPNGDSLNSPEYLKRVDQLAGTKRKGNALSSVLKPVIRKMRTVLGIGKMDYIDLLNRNLIERKIIRASLTPKEVWSVTDIHVEDLPFSTGKGISFDELRSILFRYDLVKRRSYGFFGKLKSGLPENLKRLEEKLIFEGNTTGRQLACIWRKN